MTRGKHYKYQGKDVWVVSSKRGDGLIAVSYVQFDATPNDIHVVKPSDLTPVTAQKAKPLKAERVSEKKALTDFFDSLQVPKNCQNCGKPLNAFTRFARRSVSAHILPKNDFPEIANNPDNILFMGCDFIGSACNCHNRYDASIDQRTSMPIYNLAVERYEKLLTYLAENKQIKAENYLDLGVKIGKFI